MNYPYGFFANVDGVAVAVTLYANGAVRIQTLGEDVGEMIAVHPAHAVSAVLAYPDEGQIALGTSLGSGQVLIEEVEAVHVHAMVSHFCGNPLSVQVGAPGADHPGSMRGKL